MPGPSDAERLEWLYFLRRVQIQDLDRTERWIREAEQHLSRRSPWPDRGRPGPRPTPAGTLGPSSPAPDWLVEQSIAGPIGLHTGECWIPAPGSKSLTRDEARRALAEGLPACPDCKPDTALGFVD
ncbi:DUF6233 domain-containing protein [Streptomyces sp. CAU 1734]|uniref:DUF6233 domain-containing protein n=1 Tax=Streptomyces sp. CAU 1734 TaxID=3140360 RepID=UPI003260E477